jgi:uracil-DNA glycosylase
VYIAAAVRCAPPDNKPLPAEIAACARHLDAEVAALPGLQVVVTLGQIAWNAWLDHLARTGHPLRPRPTFTHGVIVSTTPPSTLGTRTSGTSTLRTSTLHPRTSAHPHPRTGTIAAIACYHPSRQNTNTGRVTPAMYDEVFGRLGQLVR